MKHVNLLVLALAVLRFSGSAVAQHGHGWVAAWVRPRMEE